MRYRFFLFKSTLYEKDIVTDRQMRALTDALSSYSLSEIEAYKCMDEDLNEALGDLHTGVHHQRL